MYITIFIVGILLLFLSCILYIIISFNDIQYTIYKKKNIDEYKGRTVTYKEFKQLICNINRTETKKIPKFIFRSAPFRYDDLPEIISLHLIELVKNNPEYIQIYFDDDDCINFIKEYFPEYLTAYNSLRATAYKSDIWRLLVLYKYGGVYNDIGHIYKRPISDIVSEDDELILCRENGNDIHNAFIASYPTHEIIFKFIEYIIKKVNDKDYGENLLDVTGPKALGRCHALLNTDNKYNNHKIVYVLHHIYGYKDLRNSIQNSDGIDCIQTKFPNYYEIIYSEKNPHYSELWNSKQVYIED